MEDTSYWLPLIWVAILGVAVALYVVLDGFDLGIGILFPASPEEAHRDQMMNSVAPFWDGNETWLVLGGGGLLVAFPLAYSIIMPAVYLPVLIMLLALVFRGVAFEFRWVAKPHHQLWDIAFAGGSIVASFMQGVILGALLHGIEVSSTGTYAGGSLDWISAFSILTGIAVVAGYALLGATWLVMKTDGEVQAKAREQAKLLLPVVLAALLIVSLWTPLAIPRIFERWFTLPNFFLLAPVPLLAAYAAWSCWTGLASGRDQRPFYSTIALFLLGFIGLAVSNLPYIVPPAVDVWQAAAHPSSQFFMLVGVLILLPIILAYTVFVYYTFRGKVRAGEGYH
ncbi:cytochrome d ubiquinol oxidase subunit II [Hyphomicrobium sp.]|uniref:cytochrome d ubiquinol oxidase subunit II n=1 Tax=Hyphomicrobium sp. TaxID=82 RepID=UPI002E34EF3B|nr:cytochrome d ubiquinol oxidase subunit II [Hyphomicrobium sp.]HEX2839900.1 cytochrome d ubiquinol oxidase subunit II [Hyphomicrobium sp.]